jgi:hypothetical protein
MVVTVGNEEATHAPLPLSVLAAEFAAAIAFSFILDGLRIPVFARLKIS